MPLGEAALRSHGRGACHLVPGRLRWEPRIHGRPLRCFGCGNRPSRRRRGRPTDDSHWRQDFECLRGDLSAASRPAVRRQRRPSTPPATPLRHQSRRDPSHSRGVLEPLASRGPSSSGTWSANELPRLLLRCTGRPDGHMNQTRHENTATTSSHDRPAPRAWPPRAVRATDCVAARPNCPTPPAFLRARREAWPKLTFGQVG